MGLQAVVAGVGGKGGLYPCASEGDTDPCATIAHLWHLADPDSFLLGSQQTWGYEPLERPAL